tara:strand:- start:1609 stop:2421 length:813 start_codon:yes stop_codon:yes gene_type:complete
MNITCCLCIRNCAYYLPKIFNNLDILANQFNNLSIIFVYDNCTDSSEKLLQEFKSSRSYNIFILHNVNNNSHYRTIRIANARNMAIDFIYNVIPNTDFHFMIDADDVNSDTWNIDIINKYLNTNDWDCISFNRPRYYDMWALLYGDYKQHCWGFKNNSVKVIEYLKADVINKLDNLKDDELFECISAFNGFAIYRTNVFKNIKYNGSYSNFKTLITDKEREITLAILNKHIGNNIFIDDGHIEVCEHLSYHINATKINNARIRISKYTLA